MPGVHHDEWLTIIWNKHRLHYVFKDLHLLMTVPVWFWRKQERKGPQYKASLFSGRDKSEVSFWIFNILQGTKQSYSGPVSEFFFFFFEGRGVEACYVGLWIVACFLVNCCVALRESLPPKNLGNQSICEEIPLMPDVALEKKKTSKDLLVLRAPRVQTV